MSEPDGAAKPQKVQAAKADAKKTIGKLIGDDAAIAKARREKAAVNPTGNQNSNEQE